MCKYLMFNFIVSLYIFVMPSFEDVGGYYFAHVSQ